MVIFIHFTPSLGYIPPNPLNYSLGEKGGEKDKRNKL